MARGDRSQHQHRPLEFFGHARAEPDSLGRQTIARIRRAAMANSHDPPRDDQRRDADANAGAGAVLVCRAADGSFTGKLAVEGFAYTRQPPRTWIVPKV